MKQLNIKNLDELKIIFEESGYYPTEEILTEAYLGLKRLGSGITSRGQDIYTLCFDGPAGAGKTSFIKAYIKAAKQLFNEDIEMIKYQCNDTTGSGELVEEVSMVAVVVTKEEDQIIIPGKIVESILEVNKGKKVLLFIDEFDKSRRETDVFFYEFLQSGEINTVQKGDLKIDPKYKSNLQVFFCKNDFRELSGPLMRRTRNLLLDYMKPDLFYQVAKNEFINEPKEIKSLINLITLIYALAYQDKERFDRLPSPSEMLIAIEDAYELTNGISVEGKSVYSLIFKRIFKNPDDYSSFENLLETTNNEEYKKIKEFLIELKTSEEKVTIDSLLKNMLDEIFTNIMDEKTKELNAKIKECENLISTKEQELQEMIEAKRKEIEEQKKKLIEERMRLRTTNEDIHQHEVNTINLNSGDLVLKSQANIISNFNDSTEFIRRGESVFSINPNANWTSVASMTFKNNNHLSLIEQMKKIAPNINMKIYEDGILISNYIISIVLIASKNDDNCIEYNFISSSQIIPSNYITVLVEHMETFTMILKEKYTKANINALIYNDVELPLDNIMNNVYNFNVDSNTHEGLKSILSTLNLICEDSTKALESCIELIDKNTKKLTR